MIRFILERQYWDGPEQPIAKSYITIDGDLDELEKKLQEGGFSQDHGFFYNLIGAEIINIEEPRHEGTVEIDTKTIISPERAKKELKKIEEFEKLDIYDDGECSHNQTYSNKGVLTCQKCGMIYIAKNDTFLEWIEKK